ncbi:hypothetical protein CBR_g41161 [Chara braunii]|uniref:Uncharacterized protein n=1 Tax=Chara braunii TaxID=69332 RepID=A0A388K2G1_CHABU|nr:hypothetical protein CBR_g41161 [Chara braunii]|eukprot:GBG64240.1 hypothetical protein CBR_g41161 [Chara braunii]
MAGESGLAKILLWRNLCLMKVLLHEVLQESMPPYLHALLFQGRNLSSFLRDFQDFCLTKMWDKKAMWYMFPLFVCEELSEEVYTLILKSQTWDELEASLKLRFPEDEVECRLGEGPEQPAEAASTQGELNGIQRQVGMLEERLTRLEEARRGERKTFEGASNGTAEQGEAKVREDHQELLLRKKIPRGQVCALERDEGEGVIEIKDERESSMVLPVIALKPKGGPIDREAPSAAGRERRRTGKDGKAAELGRKEPAGPGASPEDSAPSPVGGTAKGTVGGLMTPAPVDPSIGRPRCPPPFHRLGLARSPRLISEPERRARLVSEPKRAGTQLGTASRLPPVAFPPSEVVVPPGPFGDAGAAPVAPSFPALVPTQQQKFSISVAVVPHVEKGSAAVSSPAVRDDWEEAITEPIGVFPPTEAKQAATHPQPNFERRVVSSEAVLSRAVARGELMTELESTSVSVDQI